MVWSGLYYALILTLGFCLIKLLVPHLAPARTIVPGYWDPDTLFDLGRITGGYAIEDAVYMFLSGGITAVLYETLFRKKLSKKRISHKPHYALTAGLVGAMLVALIPANLIYVLITFGFVAALVICIQRKDLLAHVLFGGISYLLVYGFLSFVFLHIYPQYIHDYYRVQNLSGVVIFSVPIEEFLFALSFGLSWSPIYEYVKGLRDINE
jgi:hypothetical protein